MSVKRYWKETGQVLSTVGENPEGDYVRYEDYARLSDALKAIELKSMATGCTDWAARTACHQIARDALRSERDAEAKP